MQKVLTNMFKVDRLVQLEKQTKQSIKDMISDPNISFTKLAQLIKAGRLELDMGQSGENRACDILEQYIKSGHSVMEAYIDVMNELQTDLPFMLGFNYDSMKEQILEEGRRLKKQAEDIKNYSEKAE